MQRFEFSQSVTEREWIAITLAQYAEVKGIWKLRLLIGFTWLASLAYLWASTVMHGFSSSWVGICLFIGVPLLIIWRIRQVAKKQYRTTASLQHPIHYVIDEAGVQVKAHGISSVCEWSLFTGWSEVSWFLFLYHSAAQAQVIKLAAIPPDALAFIQGHIPKK